MKLEEHEPAPPLQVGSPREPERWSGLWPPAEALLDLLRSAVSANAPLPFLEMRNQNMEKLSGLPGPLLSTAVPNSLSLA